jgi:hypothetical protein
MSRNKIASTLSAEELESFLDRCRKTPKLTLAKLQALAGEHGIEVSLMGARAFRNTTFAEHMQRLRKAQETALQMQEITAGGATINDAAASLLSQQVFDLIAEDGLDPDSASKIVKRLRDSDTRVKALQHMIEKSQTDAAERVLKDPKLLQAVAKIARDNGLTESEKIERVRLYLWGAQPANFTPHRDSGGEEQ